MNRIQPITEGRMSKGGLNEPNIDGPRPPAPGGSGPLNEKALALRNQGWKIKQIATKFGVSPRTVRRMLDPEGTRRERLKERNKEKSLSGKPREDYLRRCRNTQNKYYARMKGNLLHYVRRRLGVIALEAVKRGYVPCITPVKDVAEAYCETCQICGVDEAATGRHLAIDHCHTTGEFRGWLCFRCNAAMGLIEDHLEKALKYLASVR